MERNHETAVYLAHSGIPEIHFPIKTTLLPVLSHLFFLCGTGAAKVRGVSGQLSGAAADLSLQSLSSRRL
jgi:hypothetical protein